MFLTFMVVVDGDKTEAEFLPIQPKSYVSKCLHWSQWWLMHYKEGEMLHWLVDIRCDTVFRLQCRVRCFSHMSEIPGNLQCVPSTSTEFGKHSFRVASPRTWNSLPLRLRSPTISRQQFQSGLKTHLFKRAYIWLLLPRTIEEWTYLLTYLLTLA